MLLKLQEKYHDSQKQATNSVCACDEEIKRGKIFECATIQQL